MAENSGTIITRQAEGAEASEPKNLVIVAVHTANMDGIYKRTLGAQALAGSITGSGSTGTVSGAFAILRSKALTRAAANAGSVQKSAGNLEITASDKTSAQYSRNAKSNNFFHVILLCFRD